MPAYSDEIIVLKKTKLAETDLIITGFSASGHQVRAVVKGGRKPGSRRGSHLELYSRSQVLLHRGSSLDIVTEALLVDSHSGCRQDVEHSAAAAAVTELMEALSRDAEAEPRLFLLVDAALGCIDATALEGLGLIAAAALLKVIAQVGFQPYIDGCLVCGTERSDPAAAPMRFSFSQGGLICAECLELAADEVTSAIEAALLDWVLLCIRGRFVELAAYADATHRQIGRDLLAFARDWMRAQVTPNNRSLDFMLEIG